MPKIVAAVLASAILSALVGILYAIPVMLIWDNTIVEVFPGIKQITIFQAWGIVLLVNIFSNCGSTVNVKVKE